LEAQLSITFGECVVNQLKKIWAKDPFYFCCAAVFMPVKGQTRFRMSGHAHEVCSHFLPSQLPWLIAWTSIIRDAMTYFNFFFSHLWDLMSDD
jgi:hypothetical protein